MSTTVNGYPNFIVGQPSSTSSAGAMPPPPPPPHFGGGSAMPPPLHRGTVGLPPMPPMFQQQPQQATFGGYSVSPAGTTASASMPSAQNNTNSINTNNNPNSNSTNAMRAQMEATVRSLLEKNKALEAQSRDQQALAETEIDRLQREVISLRTANGTLQQQFGTSADAMHQLQSQTSEGQRVAGELMKQNEDIGVRNTVLLKETEHLKGLLDASYRAEEEIRAAYDDVCNKLSRADRHIRQLCDEAEAQALQCTEMQRAVAEAKELKHNTNHLKHELIEHVSKSLFNMAEEAELLMVESDELALRTRMALTATSASVTSLTVVGSGADAAATTSSLNNALTIEQQVLQAQLDKLKATKAALRAHFHQKQSAVVVAGGGGAADINTTTATTQQQQPLLEVPLRCLPEGITTLNQLTQLAFNSEATIVTIGTAVVDALSLIRDDIAVTARAVDEEGSMRRTNMTRHFRTLEEAVEGERAHTKQLLGELDSQSLIIKNLEEEKVALTKALEDMDRLMSEASHLSESSAKRTASFVEDRQRAEREAKEARDALAQIQSQMTKQTTLVGELQTEIQQWRWKAQEEEGEKTNAEHATRRAKDQVEELRRELEKVHSNLVKQRGATDELTTKLQAVEVDNATLRKQLLESDSQNRGLQGRLKAMEHELRAARDEASEANRRADKLLLQPRGAMTFAASMIKNTDSLAAPSPAPTYHHHYGGNQQHLLSPQHGTNAGNQHQQDFSSRGAGGGGLNASTISATPSVSRPLHREVMMAGAADGAVAGTAAAVDENSYPPLNHSAAAVATTGGGGSGSAVAGNKYDAWESKLTGLLERAHQTRRQ